MKIVFLIAAVGAFAGYGCSKVHQRRVEPLKAYSDKGIALTSSKLSGRASNTPDIVEFFLREHK